jgi:hypothetical protein
MKRTTRASGPQPKYSRIQIGTVTAAFVLTCKGDLPDRPLELARARRLSQIARESLPSPAESTQSLDLMSPTCDFRKDEMLSELDDLRIPEASDMWSGLDDSFASLSLDLREKF